MGIKHGFPSEIAQFEVNRPEEEQGNPAWILDTGTMKRLVLVTFLVAMANATPLSRQGRGGGYGSSNAERLVEEILEEHEDYNLVRYPETKWVCTKMMANINDDPMKGWKERFGDEPMKAMMEYKETKGTNSQMFKKLFRYIVGVNSESVEINMTTPVTTLRKPVADQPEMEEQEMCFWTGTPWQDKELPKPIDKDVYIVTKPPMDVFVRRFGGWALSREDWMEQKHALEQSLAEREDVEKVAEAGFFTVGFDSPWKQTDRRNEVWMMQKSTEGTKTNNKKKTPILGEEKLESPPYTVISENEKFEVREYPATKWVCTKMEGVDPAADPMNGWEADFNNDPFAAMGSGKWEIQPISRMFQKLFAFIAGLNSEQVEVEMTRPVTVFHQPSADGKETQEMCFWLGSKWQESPPQPSSQEVYIQERPLIRAYARKFGGFAMSYDDYHKHYLALKEDLKGASKTDFEDVEGMFFQASYDSPFIMKNRRNEVWIQEKKAA